MPARKAESNGWRNIGERRQAAKKIQLRANPQPTMMVKEWKLAIKSSEWPNHIVHGFINKKDEEC
jgi:hypothetical protein